jgi:Sad1 / UNC-like C-terminal
VPQGPNQWIAVSLREAVKVSQISIQFQGGFSAKEIHLQTSKSSSAPETIEKFYPQDTNSLQHFPITTAPLIADNLRFHFPQSTDTFGRIIVYKLCIYEEK